jgi:hypothetical protein
MTVPSNTGLFPTMGFQPAPSNGVFPNSNNNVLPSTVSSATLPPPDTTIMPTVTAPPQALAPWAFINQPTPLSQQLPNQPTNPMPPTLMPEAVPPSLVTSAPPIVEQPAQPVAEPTVPVEEIGTLPDEKTAPVIVRGFDNSVIRNLNRRLEDPDWQKRAEAANDFSMILGANPNLERRAAYKPYVDAFMLKILRDSSAVVHEPALRSIQVGYYRHPTQAVLEELNALKVGVGLFGLEPQMVTDALYALYTFQQQEQAEAQKAQQAAPPSTQPQTQLVG